MRRARINRYRLYSYRAVRDTQRRDSQVPDSEHGSKAWFRGTNSVRLPWYKGLAFEHVIEGVECDGAVG